MQTIINNDRANNPVFQPNSFSELVMVGKVTRNDYLSGYLAPILMGDSPYYKINQLFAHILHYRKVAGFEPMKVEPNEAMKWGNKLEYINMAEAVNILGFDIFNGKIRTATNFFKSNRLLFQVSLDGKIENKKTKVIYVDNKTVFTPQGLADPLSSFMVQVEGNGVIECKNHNGYFSEVPKPHLGVWQLQMQLMATGYSWGIISILYNGNRQAIYLYKEDLEMQKRLIKACKDFYRRVEGIEKGGDLEEFGYPIEDKVDASALYPKSESDLSEVNLADIGDEVLELVRQKSLKKTVEERISQLEGVVMGKLGNSEKGYLEDNLGNNMVEVSWKMRRTKAQPKKTVEAKPEKYERAKTLTVKEIR